MQVLPEDSFAKRSLYYWGRVYTEQLEEGAPYSLLTKTICINILNFEQLPDEPDYHNIYKMKNVKSNSELLDECEIHFIELRKYDENLADSLSTALGRWVHFLKLAGMYDADSMPEQLKEAPSFQKAMHLLERLSASKEEREIYEDRMKWLRDVTSSLETMERRGLAAGERAPRARNRATECVAASITTLHRRETAKHDVSPPDRENRTRRYRLLRPCTGTVTGTVARPFPPPVKYATIQSK